MTETMTELSAASKALAGNHGFSLISDEKLLALYATMLRCRLIAERINALPAQADFSWNENALGQEAALTGVALDLLAGDAVVASRHNLGVGFIHGVPLRRLFAQAIIRHSETISASTYRAAESACTKRRVFLHNSDTASQLDRALDLAQANKIADNGKIVVVFCDAASNAKTTWSKISHDALRFASHHSLPILIVCLHPTRQNGGRLPLAAEEIALSATNCGFPGIPVDGSDVVALYRVATESIARVRQGHGPTLIECLNWPGDKQATELHRAARPYRTVANDPLSKMERYLTRKGLFSNQYRLATANSFANELDKALGAFLSNSALDVVRSTPSLDTPK